MTIDAEAGRLAQTALRVRQNVERVIVGKGQVVELVLTALLCEGHVLVEDVPGIGKTMLARSIARSLGCTFRRIQCTPDLLPSDITGTYIFNQQTGRFEFREGPIFSQVVLADEINRATPRTQSALLEAMEERQVTADGQTMPLPRPFLLLATQNPVELEGTFPLPEAQLDRFFLKVTLGYPTREDDREILRRYREANPIQELEPVITSEELLDLQRVRARIEIDPELEDYIIGLVHSTRTHPRVELGASPRAMLAVYRAGQALAGLRGRSYVIPDDIKYVFPFVVSHRLMLKAQSHLHGETVEEVIQEVLESVPVPVEQEAGRAGEGG